MTPEEIEVFRRTTENQIAAIAKACAPYWWKGGDFKEAKEATGCTHPLDRIAPVEWLAGIPVFGCANCGVKLDRDHVRLRLDQSGQRSRFE